MGEIKDIPATAQSTFFEFSMDGNVIYSCGKGRFVVDLKKKTVTKSLYEPLGYNFFVESEENPGYGRIVKYESTEAGKKWCILENARATMFYAAFKNDIVYGEERYPQGVVVWNSITKKWTSFESSSFCNIIGWIEE
jgi:hypothetical protein